MSSKAMGSTDRRMKLLSTPFVASWIGEARPDASEAARLTGDLDRRRVAWAQWAVLHLTEVDSGRREEPYPAFWLDAKFYRLPGSSGDNSDIRPHIEIPSSEIAERDEEFPTRLALFGNALAFAWFKYSEVTAFRRKLFRGRVGGSIEPAATLLSAQHAAIATYVEELLHAVGPKWQTVEELLVTHADELLDTVCGSFEPDEVVEAMPFLADVPMEVRFDERMREKNGSYTPRRLGVWRVFFGSGRSRAAFGVVTPRLTANSMFSDDQFSPARESPAALMVRALLLRRLLHRHLQEDVAAAEPVSSQQPRGHLQSKPAQPGAKLPQPSVGSAINFIQSYADADGAWQALTDWAGERYTLTPQEDEFKEAFRRAKQRVSRAEDPSRSDIERILPIVWDRPPDGSVERVARVTFSRMRDS